MRAFGKISLMLAAVVALVGVGMAQPPAGGFGKGGGKGKATDAISLLNNVAVRDELKVTPEQIAKIPAAARKAAGEVLDAKQAKRLKEIELQQLGNNAYLDADVKKELKITDDQAKKIKEAIDTAAKEQADLLQGGGFDLDKITELNKKATDSVQAVLNADQKKSWTTMTGAAFELPGAFGKGGAPKKGA